MNSFPDLYITQLLPRLEGVKKVNGEWADLMTGRAVSDEKFEWAMKHAIMERFPEENRAAFALKVQRAQREAN